MTAFVHFDECVSALHCFQFVGEIARHTVANVPDIEVVGRANENYWILFGCVFRAIDVGRHAFSVAHRNHQLALDDSNRLQLTFDRVSAGDQFRACSASTLSAGSILKKFLTGYAENSNYYY